MGLRRIARVLLLCLSALPLCVSSVLAQDLDRDGIPDRLEDALAAKFVPKLHVYLQNECAIVITGNGQPGHIPFMVYRAFYPSANGVADPDVMVITFEVLYSLDCGKPEGHAGDNEPFAIFLRYDYGLNDWAYDSLATVAHYGAGKIFCEHPESIPVFPPPPFSRSAEFHPTIYVGYQKHGNHVDTSWGGCYTEFFPNNDALFLPPAGQDFIYPASSIFNVGESSAQRLNDLGAVNPLWSGQRVWGGSHFFDAGVIQEELTLDPAHWDEHNTPPPVGLAWEKSFDSGNCTPDGMVSSTAVQMDAAGGPATILVQLPTTCGWRLATSDPWISATVAYSSYSIILNPAATQAGAGSGSVSVTVSPNTSSAARSGSILIGSTTVAIQQEGLGCGFSADTLSFDIDAAGGSRTGHVSATAGDCSWSASVDVPWLSLIGPTAGSGSTSLGISVDANQASTPRVGHVFIGGAAITINQAGVGCSYSLAPSNAVFDVAGGNGLISVSATPSGCSWTALSNASWITITASSGSHVSYSVSPNATGSDRSGTLSVAGITFGVSQTGNGAPVVQVTSPANGTIFNQGQTIHLAATATDSDGVARVDFYVDGTLVASTSTPPFSTDISQLSGGWHTVYAAAVDTLGASGQSRPITIGVNNLGTISFDLTSPSVGDAVQITVTGQNPCGAVDLDFGDGQHITYAITALPMTQTHRWATGGTFHVTATGEGNCTGILNASISITAPPGPAVALASPADGGTVVYPQPVVLIANASDPAGIGRVDFYVDGTPVASVTAAPYQTSVPLDAGTYSFFAIAYNNLGVSTSSALVHVSVVHLASIAVNPTALLTGQPATVTVSGSAAGCGAVQIDYGDGSVTTYAISGLPHAETHTWRTSGTFNLVATGQGSCIGSVTTSISVSTDPVPSVSLTSPVTGTYTVGSVLTLSASASDGQGIGHVDFFADDTLIGTVGTAPYNLAWQVLRGTTSLTAMAFDVYGASARSGAVTVVGQDVMGVSATPGSALVGNPVAVVVTGSTACGAVQIDFGPGASAPPQVYAISGLPFQQTVSWNTGGTKTITATGQGANCSGQASGTATVVADNPPSVTLTNPVNGSTLAAGSSITLTAVAADSDGSVARVEFYAGSTLLATVTSAPYSFSWANPAVGTYSITAQAVDNLGLRTISTAASVTVANLVTGVSASPSSVVTGQSTTVTVTGSSACGAVGIDFGPGASHGYQVYAINGLPYSIGVWWNSTGTKTITATGNGSCGGQVTTTVNVATDTPPSVSMTSPASGSAYTSGTIITLSASASDSDGIAHVDFYINGVYSSSVASAPYNVNWSVWSGTSYIQAKAYDVYGASTMSGAVAVTGRDVVGLSVSSGLTVGDMGSVTVSGSSSCGAIAIDYGDGTAVTYPISGLPVSETHAWGTGGWFYVTATGQSSCVGQAAAWVYVNWPPSVTLTAPVYGNTYVGPATIGMSASASDPDGSIVAVTFYANSTPLTTLYGPPYSFNWNAVPVGNYWIWAAATDNAGVVRGSNASYVSVQDPGPSTVTSVVMSSQTVSVGQYALIEVFGTNPCGLVQVNTGDGNAPYTPISSLPYYQWYAWGAPGVYTITITGGGNCHGQASTTITVVGAPVPSPAPEQESDDAGPARGPSVDAEASPAPASSAPLVDNVIAMADRGTHCRSVMCFDSSAR